MAWNKYAYSDFHELNADYILKQLREIDAKIDSLVEEAKAAAIAAATQAAKDYVDERLNDILVEFETLNNEFGEIKRSFEILEGEVDDLEDDFADFVDHVESRLDYYTNYIDAQIAAVNHRTDAAIEANNEYLLETMGTYLAQIKVLNFFTGEYVSIQDMFDYLSQFHANDAIDYTEMASRSKTYNQLAALNITYTDLAVHGNSVYV